MKKDYTRTETISYRITKEQWEKIHEKASKEKKTVNDWCRSLAEQSLDDHHGLAPGMQVLLAEIYNLREFVEAAFFLQSRAQLNEDELFNLLLESTTNRQLILRKYFDRQNISESEPKAQPPTDAFAEPNPSSSNSNSAQEDERLPERSSENFTDSDEGAVAVSGESVHQSRRKPDSEHLQTNQSRLF